MRNGRFTFILLLSAIPLLYHSCAGSHPSETISVFNYQHFRDSLLKTGSAQNTDSSNLFDDARFIPGKDSLNDMLERIDTLWKQEAHLMSRLDSLRRKLKPTAGFTEEEKQVIRDNIREVDSFLLAKDSVVKGRCKGTDCILYVEVDKSRQLLFVSILGERKDTFKVSTGKGKKYETPSMELNPQGPVLTKYTSKKFPGGNYAGLGNMPYAVFLKNGYAIHGTTPGNFSKLGQTASHGCIRLHPDHGKILNALVKTIGINQTWVSVRDSIPE